MTIEEGAKDMEREKDIMNFMRKVLDFLKENKCSGINRNVNKHYVTINFKESAQNQKTGDSK